MSGRHNETKTHTLFLRLFNMGGAHGLAALTYYFEALGVH